MSALVNAGKLKICIVEIKVNVPFQQLLNTVRNLSPAQKAELRRALNDEQKPKNGKKCFLDFLITGPVYTGKELAVIEENRKSIAAWRTKRPSSL